MKCMGQNLPFRFDLQVFANLGGFVREHVLELLLLLSEHLDFALRKLDLFIDLSDHLLQTAQLGLQTALRCHLVGAAHLTL